MSWQFVGRTYIPLPPEQVFPYVSTVNGFKKWFVRRCQLDPRPGGRFNLTFTKSDTILAMVTRIAPNEAFCFEWPLDDVHPVTQVEIALERLGNGTLVKISDGEYEEDLKEVRRFQTIVQGWTGYLWNLKSVVVYGTDLRSEWE